MTYGCAPILAIFAPEAAGGRKYAIIDAHKTAGAKALRHAAAEGRATGRQGFNHS